MAHYEPASSDRPTKRRRRDDESRGQERRENRHDDSRKNTEGAYRAPRNSYRPSRGPYGARRTDRRTEPVHKPTEDQSDPQERSASPSSTTLSKNKKKHTSPSDRIHSLKKQLQRNDDSLSGTVRQEKERELAALLFEQEKLRLARDKKQMIQRYHMVRFFERRKAERVLKQLNRQREQKATDGQPIPDELTKSIHETEVDVKYAVYAPLSQKYISLYAESASLGGKNKTRTKKQILNTLNKDQKSELMADFNEQSNVLQLAAGTKPPMWYEVEKCMEHGQAKLDALRDGKLADPLGGTITLVGGKDAALERGKESKTLKRKPSWLDDEGMIDPEDLDSDEDDGMGDGGFFER